MILPLQAKSPKDTTYNGLPRQGGAADNLRGSSLWEDIMKRSFLSLPVALFLAVTVAQVASPKAQNDQNTMTAKSFRGEIMDSACAEMGSHKQMEAKEGAKTARECTEACVKNGSTLVLYNPSTKMTYQLSDQDKAKAYAGEWVHVKGAYDASSKTITVDTITRSHSTAHSTSSSR